MKILEGAAHPEMWKFTEKSSSTRPRSDGKSKQSRSFATKQRRSDHPADPSRRGFKKKIEKHAKKGKRNTKWLHTAGQVPSKSPETDLKRCYLHFQGSVELMRLPSYKNRTNSYTESFHLQKNSLFAVSSTPLTYIHFTACSLLLYGWYWIFHTSSQAAQRRRHLCFFFFLTSIDS